MMICLRKNRIGEGVSEGLAFIFILFLVGGRVRGGGGEDRLHLLHVPGLHMLAS